MVGKVTSFFGYLMVGFTQKHTGYRLAYITMSSLINKKFYSFKRGVVGPDDQNQNTQRNVIFNKHVLPTNSKPLQVYLQILVGLT